MKYTNPRMSATIPEWPSGRHRVTTYGHISIMRGDMKLQHETIHQNDPRYAEALEIFA